MAQPLIVTIPHQLGEVEAIARLQSGFNAVQAKFGQLLSFQEQLWTGNHIQFRLTALAQSISGAIYVFNDHVRLEIVFPWLLAKIAERIQPLIRKEAKLLLEKK
jgi:hypothetical protein